MVFASFWSEVGYNFACFGLESVMVFGELRECMNVFIISIPNGKKERKICKLEMDFKKSFFVAVLI